MEKLIKKFIPMSETMFYILFSFKKERHGYAVMKYVSELTKGRIQLGAGTIYQTIKKLEKSQLIRFCGEEDRQKRYVITDIGREILKLEIKRIKTMYQDVQEEL